MSNLNEQLKQQGLISSFGQPLDSSELDNDCVMYVCLTCTACIGCTWSCTTCGNTMSTGC